ncbi:Serine protease [Rhyzopertha dominica]|nr:Serine protease [Rhyzopertha dominica]
MVKEDDLVTPTIMFSSTTLLLLLVSASCIFALPAINNEAIMVIDIPEMTDSYYIEPSDDAANNKAFSQTFAKGVLGEPMLVTKDIRIDENANWRVVGGSTASNGQFPYIVSLRQNSGHFCGGTILSTAWILTAAHCTVGVSANAIVAVAGTNTLNSGGARYGIARIINHASYSSQTLANDIALIRTSSNIALSSTVSTLPISNSNVGAGVTVTLSGWGRTSFPGNIPNNLQFINLRSISNADCQRQHTNPIYNSQLCTFTQRGQGACHGDSGGPLATNGVLVGVVSWGQPCAIGFPDVFTRVSSYVNWILSSAN